MIHPSKIDHTTLMVKSIKRSKDYYERIFDFDCATIDNSSDKLMVENEEMHFFIIEADNVADEILSMQHISFEVENLDLVISKLNETSIERLQKRFLTIHSFRDEAAKALVNLLNHPGGKDCVVALPPSGLMGGYLRALKKANGTTVVISDKPENILERIRFYDIDSRPIEKKLTLKDKKLYLREIKKDITYFRTSYRRAKLHVEISGLDPYQAAFKIIEAVEQLEGNIKKQPTGEPDSALDSQGSAAFDCHVE